MKWTDTNHILVEEQSGFRKMYATVDDAFILHSIVDKYLRQKNELSVCFVDFRKAIVSVRRDSLWLTSQKYSISRKLLNIIRSMYSSVQCCVRSNGDMSELFECPLG